MCWEISCFSGNLGYLSRHASGDRFVCSYQVESKQITDNTALLRVEDPVFVERERQIGKKSELELNLAASSLQATD